MIPIQRPGQSPLEIECILVDFEGTLAVDGRVDPKAKDKINLLSKRTRIYVLTTSGQEDVAEALRKVKAEVIPLKEGEGTQKKLNALRQAGEERTVVIGNGMNDLGMIKKAGLSIGVISKEGTAAGIFEQADLVFMSLLDALDFLLKPLRQKATLGK